MIILRVQIESFVDEHFPGFVGCVLIDANGLRHEFIEKGPVVSTNNLRSDSVYPQPGYIGCIIEDEWVDELGRRLVRVDTEMPWGIELVGGTTSFTVLEKQVLYR